MRTGKALPRTFAAWVLLACAGASAQEQVADQPEQLVNRFIAAWNAHDAPAFGKLFAGDADWVTASGIDLQGRDKIQAYLAEEHSTWAKSTIMTPSDIRVRRMDENTATVFFKWRITRETPNMDSRHGNNVFVATRSSTGWIIVAGQVARKGAA